MGGDLNTSSGAEEQASSAAASGCMKAAWISTNGPTVNTAPFTEYTVISSDSAVPQNLEAPAHKSAASQICSCYTRIRHSQTEEQRHGVSPTTSGAEFGCLPRKQSLL